MSYYALDPQRLYLLAIYGWSMYMYADSYYSTAKRIYRLANGTYWVSSVVYNTLTGWTTKEIEMVEVKPPGGPSITNIELHAIMPKEPMINGSPGLPSEVAYFGGNAPNSSA